MRANVSFICEKRHMSSCGRATLIKVEPTILTVHFVGSIATVVIAVAHHLIWHALPVGALELRYDAAARRRRTVALVRTVAAVVRGVTELPTWDAALICAAELVMQTAVIYYKEGNRTNKMKQTWAERSLRNFSVECRGLDRASRTAARQIGGVTHAARIPPAPVPRHWKENGKGLRETTFGQEKDENTIRQTREAVRPNKGKVQPDTPQGAILFHSTILRISEHHGYMVKSFNLCGTTWIFSNTILRPSCFTSSNCLFSFFFLATLGFIPGSLPTTTDPRLDLSPLPRGGHSKATAHWLGGRSMVDLNP